MSLYDGSMTSQELLIVASGPQIPKQVDRTTAADNAPSEIDQLWSEIEVAAQEALQRLISAGSPGGHRYEVVVGYTPARTWYLRRYQRRSTRLIVAWKLDEHHNGYVLGEDGKIHTAKDVVMDPPPRRRDGHYWSDQAWHEARAHARPTVERLEFLREGLRRLFRNK